MESADWQNKDSNTRWNLVYMVVTTLVATNVDLIFILNLLRFHKISAQISVCLMVKAAYYA